MSMIESFDIGGGMTAGVYVDPQAHAMSHPGNDAMPEQAGRRHVSQAGWLASSVRSLSWDALEAEMRQDGTVLLTVEEHEELLRQTGWESIARWNKAECERFERENEALRAEVERLTNEDMRLNSIVADLLRENERLRKGQDNVRNDDVRMGATRGDCAATGDARRDLGNLLVYEQADTLDPRLGIQQPQGEAVQPMPYWRRRMGD